MKYIVIKTTNLQFEAPATNIQIKRPANNSNSKNQHSIISSKNKKTTQNLKHEQSTPIEPTILFERTSNQPQLTEPTTNLNYKNH